jgi:putative transcriptional regulator
MPDRNIGNEILNGIQEIKNFKKGKVSLKTYKLEELGDYKQIRERLKLSQAAFANLIGVSVRTVRDWEHGKRAPGGPARSLLRIADKNPKAFLSLT